MAVLLFSVGTFALVAGLVMVGFGIPINEFSFGNTLISAGTTAAVGGLIIIALGVAVGQLRRIAEALAGDLPAQIRATDGPRGSHAVLRSPAAGIPDRIPFPPRPRSETPLPKMGSLPAAPTNTASDDGYDQFAAPTLPNPEEAPMAVEDEISLSPPQPSGGSAPTADVRGPAGRGQEPATSWKPSPASTPPVGSPPRPLQPAKFDAMWPAEAKSPKSSVSDDAKPPSAPARDTFPPDQTSRARSAKAAYRRHSEVRCRRRDGLHALCRWLDRGGIATRHIAFRLDQRTAKSPRKEFIARAGLHLLLLFLVFLSRDSAFVAYDPILSCQTMSFFLQLQKWDSSFKYRSSIRRRAAVG